MLTIAGSLWSCSTWVARRAVGSAALRARLAVVRDFVLEVVSHSIGVGWADEVARREAARVVVGMLMVYDRVCVQRETSVASDEGMMVVSVQE